MLILSQLLSTLSTCIMLLCLSQVLFVDIKHVLLPFTCSTSYCRRTSSRRRPSASPCRHRFIVSLAPSRDRRYPAPCRLHCILGPTPVVHPTSVCALEVSRRTRPHIPQRGLASSIIVQRTAFDMPAPSPPPLHARPVGHRRPCIRQY